jgi:hypothetical protein
MTQSRIRRRLAVVLLCAGCAVFTHGCDLETRNPRSNGEDDIAWLVLGVGVALIAAGASLPYVPIWLVPVIAVVSPYAAFVITVVAVWSIIILNAFLRFL